MCAGAQGRLKTDESTRGQGRRQKGRREWAHITHKVEGAQVQKRISSLAKMSAKLSNAITQDLVLAY